MPSNGQLVVQAALKYLGTSESPWGSNTGPTVDLFTGHYGMHAVPWCGCFAGYAFFTAGVDDSGLCSPSVQVTCDRARAGGFVHEGGPVPAGALWADCGVHVEIVIRDNGDGTTSNIGGNVNQQVMLTRRHISDALICVPAAIAQGQPDPVTVYGFDDLTLRPNRYGGWPTREQRETVIDKLPADLQKRVRRMRVPAVPSPFAFEIATAAQWRFGPWQNQGGRDAAQHRYARGHADHRLRPWALVQDPGPAPAPGAVTTGDTQI